MHHFSWIKLLPLLPFMLNWKHPQPISKKKWNERMSQHRSEEFYSRPASQRWASWCDWSQAIKSCGGHTSWHHNHHTTLYTIPYFLRAISWHHDQPTTLYRVYYTPYFLTATSWHGDHRCSYATHRFQHTRRSWRLCCFWSLSFFVVFFWAGVTGPSYFLKRRSCLQNCKHA